MMRTVAGQMGANPKDFDPITASEGVAGVLSVVDKATKETHGGKFWNYTGEQFEW